MCSISAVRCTVAMVTKNRRKPRAFGAQKSGEGVYPLRSSEIQTLVVNDSSLGRHLGRELRDFHRHVTGLAERRNRQALVDAVVVESARKEIGRGESPRRETGAVRAAANRRFFNRESRAAIRFSRHLEDFGEGFEGGRDHLIIGMFYATGMRLSELIGLKDADVDFSASVIKVTGKRNKQRLIPFDEELRQEMESYINIRNEAVPVRADAFFVRKTGEQLYAGLVQKLVKRYLSKVVTVKKKSPHVLRHTFATVMLNNGADLGAIKELLGHESLATTEIYTHTTFEELKKVYNRAHPRA